MVGPEMFEYPDEVWSHAVFGEGGEEAWAVDGVVHFTKVQVDVEQGVF